MITDTETSFSFVGNGVTTIFPMTNCVVYTASHVVVKVDGSIVTNYTVNDLGASSGVSVEFTAAPASSAVVLCYRSVPYEQQTDFINFDGNPSEVTEKQHDLTVMMSQQLSDEMSRAIRFPIGDTASASLPASSTLEGKFVYFTGGVFTGATGVSDVAVSAAMTPVVQAATLAAGRTALDVYAKADVYTKAEIGNIVAYKNKLMNGNFIINQRAVSGTVSLASGAFGHDRWKAGSSGCTYTFSKSGGVTTLTISAGSLIQTVEADDIIAGDHTVSWVGTAKIFAGGDSGDPRDSGYTVTLTSADSAFEFGTGTLSKVQVEAGTVATAFEHRPVATEFEMCQRYLPAFKSTNTVSYTGAIGVAGSTTTVNSVFKFPVKTRIPVTGITVSAASQFSVSDGATNTACTAVVVNGNPTTDACGLTFTVPSGLTQYRAYLPFANNSSGSILFTGAEL